jgi:hypothetical protein
MATRRRALGHRVFGMRMLEAEVVEYSRVERAFEEQAGG